MSRDVRVAGHHRYIRARTLDLAAELQNSLPMADRSLCRYLHLYCDEITGPSTTEVVGSRNGTLHFGKMTIDRCSLRFVHVFARSFCGNVPSGTNVTIKAHNAAGESTRFTLAVFYEIAPENLFVNAHWKVWKRHEQASGVSFFKTSNFDENPSDPWGASVVEGDDIVNLHETELSSLDGSAGMFPFDNLSLLLVDMFGWASELVFSTLPGDEEKAKSMFRYIVTCTRSSASHAALCTSAQRVLSRLELPSKWALYPVFSKACQRFDVPVLTLERYKELLEPMIRFLADIESQQRMLESNAILESGQVNTTKAILENMALTLSPFSGKSATGEEALSAIRNAASKHGDMKTKASDVDRAFRELGANLQDHIQKSQTLQGIGNIFKSQAEAAGSAAVGDPSGILDYVGTLFSEIKGIFDRGASRDTFEEAVDAFGQQIRSLSREVETATKITAKTKTFSERNGRLSDNETEWLLADICSEPIDYFGMLATWEVFRIDTRRTLEEFDGALEDLSESHNSNKELRSVKGLSEYADELDKMILYGRTVLDTEREAQTLLIAHLRAKCEQIERAQVKARISAAANAEGFERDADKKRLVAAELEQQAIKLRNYIFVALFETSLSYIYRASLPGWPSDFSISTVNADSSTLRSKLLLLENMFKTTDEKGFNRSVSPTPVRVVHEGSVLDRFKRDKVMSWVIPPQHYDLAGLFNIRCTNVYAVFETAEGKQENVAYQIRIGPSFLDKNSDGMPLHFTIEPLEFRKVDNRGGPTSSGRYIRPPVCCFGELELDSFSNPKLKVEELTKVTVNFEFESDDSKKLQEKARQSHARP
ncbi:hypothetical protein HII31_01411 [Pseudocercospora fuligena]|uniref:Uncharacterized protein n=1 Tax=Pseudocercospora fuligena TaxID=685502 RepID=A0A8H6RW14_9PEZI|nr:hypothetical protein HII31_01411 [Pseudocercospora fuligena]